MAGLVPFPIGNIVMIGVGCLLIYLAVRRGYEPLLLIPIGFGAVLVNLPYGGLMDPGGVLRVLYDIGVATELFPILIFIGIGAMIDFGALLERPWIMVFSIPAQLGIAAALLLSLAIGLHPAEAISIGIIGAMDGPTAIFVTSMYAPKLLGPVSVAAYSYIATIPLVQVPLSKALISKRERRIKMTYTPKAYSKSIRILFPIFVTIVTGLAAPKGIALIGSLMFGNFLRESGVVERLSKSAQNELVNLTTLLLGVTIGGTMLADRFLTTETVAVFLLGIVAFVTGLSCGLLFAKMACYVTKGRINPLIGATGVSAFPMAARTAHMIAHKEDPDNWLLMHALAANAGGQIASVVAGGAILTYAGLLGVSPLPL